MFSACVASTACLYVSGRGRCTDVFLKFFLNQIQGLRTESVTIVHILKLSQANSLCDFGLHINLI